MLRDRLVCGCQDKRLQYKLLADPELTYEKAMTAAKASETADHGAKGLTGGTVHHVSSRRHRPQPPKSFIHPQHQHPPTTQPCSRCGAPHSPSVCKFKTATCHYCKKQGHLASVCRKKARDLKSNPQERGDSKNHQLEAVDPEEIDQEGTAYSLFYSTSLGDSEQFTYHLASRHLSIMSEKTYHMLWTTDARPSLLPSSARLSTYTGEQISVLGAITVDVLYQHQQYQLQMLIVPGTGPTQLGRDWLQCLRLDWARINVLRSHPDQLIEQVLNRYPEVFRDCLGHIKSAPASLHVDSTHQPRFYKARPIPYSLRPKVDAELSRLQEQGVITPVQFADWAAPDQSVSVGTTKSPSTLPQRRISTLCPV